MLDDTQTPKSPGWWLMRLGKKLAANQPRYEKLDCYWRGDPPMPHGHAKMREAYRRLQRISRINFANLVSETVLERAKVIGFRAGSSGNSDTDRTAWSWWQANNLDSVSGMVHRASSVMSRAYVCVGRDPDDPSKPLVTGEDPRQVIHESSPTNMRKVLAEMKTWLDDIDGVQRAEVYYLDKVYFFVTAKSVSQNITADQLWAPTSWQVDTSTYPDGIGANPLGEPPFVPFNNRPDLGGGALGEFEDEIDTLDRIHMVILDRLVISAMQAYKQRVATGVNPVNKDGVPQNSFDPGADIMWISPNKDAKFTEFGSTDITPIIKAAEADIQYLAAVTRTPPHYLLAGIVNASGDALATAETGLVSKITERETEWGESWEQVYRLVGKVTGQEVPPDSEVIWADPQYRSLAERADAALKLRQAGVPWRSCMEILGKTPQEIDRMEAERLQDAMLSDTLASLSIAEGGELGNRGVAYKTAPTDGSTPSTPATQQAAPQQPTGAAPGGK